MVGINSRGIPKIWINQNFALNSYSIKEENNF